MMSSVGTCLPCNGVPRVSWKYLWHARHWSWRRPTPRMAVGANVAAPHPTIVGTRFLGAIMLLRIHIARAATPGHDQLR